MPAAQTFTAFFSYAHHDAEADPDLIEALTTRLEKRVSGKILNGRLEIWRDTKGLRTGARWDSAIEAAVRGADLLIVLLTPKWIESEYCRKEYLIFEEVEAGRDDGEYIAPILAEPVDNHEHHLLPDQKPVYESLHERQYFEILATNFLTFADRRRDAAVDRIAQDIAGIIERRRQSRLVEPRSAPGTIPRRRTPPAEFAYGAQDYNEVGIVSGKEAVIDRPRHGKERGVFAQVGFVERLFVRSDNGHRVEFGVRRAFVTVVNRGPGTLSQADEMRMKGLQRSAYYVPLHDKPDGITVCADPGPNRATLAELALPPTSGENYLARIATATDDVDAKKMEAEVRFALNPDKLYLRDGSGLNVSQKARSQIKAIIDASIRKGLTVDRNGDVRLPIPVRERER